RPGQQILQKKMTVEQAIAMAGGIGPDGLYGKVFLRRVLDGAENYVEFEIDLDKNDASKQDGDMLVEPDDIIRVDHNDLFSVFGEVNRPGEFVLRKNMTVLNALSTAGGLNKWGSSNRVKVLRSKDELESSIITIDVESIIKGDTTANIKLLPGDTLIVEPGLF
ncbi:MAG: SLBB domain-containing protein, partial [Candidatus Brocadiales bacterium]|nr:SLBB domain-containing protein [Candidatus Brocadiales bacterium]